MIEIARVPLDATHVDDCSWDRFPPDAIEALRNATGVVTAELVIWEEPSVPEYEQDWHNAPRTDAVGLSPETAQMWRDLVQLAEGDWSYAPC